AVPTTQESITASPTAQQELSDTAKAERIKQEKDIAQAKKLVEAATQARAQNRFDESLRDYSQAVQLDPNNEMAVQGRREMLELMGRSTEGKTLTDVE